MSNDTIFAKGLIVKRRDTAPEYVLCSLSVRVEEFIEFLREHDNEGWVNIECKVSGSTGKLYASLDTWRPSQGAVNRQGMEQARAAASGGTPGQRKGPDPAQAPVPPPGDYGNFDDGIPF